MKSIHDDKQWKLKEREKKNNITIKKRICTRFTCSLCELNSFIFVPRFHKSNTIFPISFRLNRAHHMKMRCRVEQFASAGFIDEYVDSVTVKIIIYLLLPSVLDADESKKNHQYIMLWWASIRWVESIAAKMDYHGMFFDSCHFPSKMKWQPVCLN